MVEPAKHLDQRTDETSTTNHLDQRKLEKRGEAAEQVIFIPLKEENP